MGNDTVTITDNRDIRQIDFAILGSTLGPVAVDIGRFFRELGLFTYDPGFL